MATHPYKSLPDYCFWRKSHDVKSIDEIDPVIRPLFTIAPDDAVVTSGSCFAQHIARYLGSSGYNYLITETPHPLIPDDIARAHNYGVFTARYGNVYTTRQLLQLFQRVYGEFTPQDTAWKTEGGAIVDPFRPQITPGGYINEAEMLADRARHFEATQEAFEKADIFVFTLGLTEAWLNKKDGAVYPMCPGVAGGEFDTGEHAFINFSVEEVISDFMEFLRLLREKNPKVKVIVTVSPVPLMATALDRSVLVSTCYSKAVLRVAADEITRKAKDVAYFPSYEIVTGNFARGHYFGTDCRDVTTAGVAHVMELFMKHYGALANPVKGRRAGNKPAGRREKTKAEEFEAFGDVLEVVCDEEALDNAS